MWKHIYNECMPRGISHSTLTDVIQSQGFSHFGVISPAPLSQDFENYKRWLEAGCHGRMEYLARESGLITRANPACLFPEARSIIILAAPYPIDRMGDEKPGLFGKVSSYARGQDYHEVLRRKLEKIAFDLTVNLGMVHQTFSAIDSSPILEKPLARLAGLGWTGRNSCLIHPEHGSFFFLANLFTTLEIEPTSTEIKPRCGDCHRCVDACPTHCIRSDHSIDASRCVSYLTIENKSDIPLEFRKNVGQRLFGCDVCQAVCPWNHKPDNSSVLPEFQAKSESDVWIDLTRIVRLSSAEFKEEFKFSPVLRAKRNGLIRNACVILGNIQSDEAIPHLSRLLQEESVPMIRGHAAWGLGRINSPASRDVLSHCLTSEMDPCVLDEIKSALSMD